MLDLARHAQVQFSLALLVLLVCLGAVAIRNVLGRPPAPDLVIPAWLRGREIPARFRRVGRQLLDGGLALAALVLALATMTAARPDGSGIDRARVLHEVVQAKYHAELGWDRLYACAWAADHDAGSGLGGIQMVRSLALEPVPELRPSPEPEYRIQIGENPRKVRLPFDPSVGKREPPPEDVGGKLLPSSAAANQAECHDRFDEDRWAALGADVGTLGLLAPNLSMAPVLEGFGSTTTPSRLARQRLVFSVVGLSARSMFVLTLLAGVLVLGALVLVERAYGLRAAGLIGIVCFVEFAGSPIAGGVGVAGMLTLACLLAGFAATELDRWALGGALLAFAAVELVWPALLVAGVLAKLAADTLDPKGRSRKRELARFAIGAGASAAAFLLLSASLPGGLDNWSTWADRVIVHRYADGSRQVGLQWLFAPDGSWLGGPREVAYPAKAQNLVDRHDWALVCGVLLLAPALLAVRRLPPAAFAAIAGVTACFALFSVDASNYGLAVPLLALAAAAVAKHHAPSELFVGRPATVLVAGCLALSVGMHGMVRLHSFAPWLFNMVYSHMLTTVLLGLGVALLLLPGLREHGDPPGAPASVPVLEPEADAQAQGGQP